MQVQPCRHLDDFKAALYGIGQYFGPPAANDRLERFLRLLELDRMHAAWKDEAIVGGAGAFRYMLSVPGGRVPCAGVTVVGVYPTHRRTGVLTAMMRAQLDDIHARSEPIAALWASEERIYGRFGYGMASLQGPTSLPRTHNAFAKPITPVGTIRFVNAAEALTLFPPVWEKLADQRTGVFSRTSAWWELRPLADPAELQSNPKRMVVLEDQSSALSLSKGALGYATYRQHPKIEGGFSRSRLDVLEAIGTTPAATAQLWRYLLDIDWIETFTVDHMPIDHPLFHLLASPRHLQLKAMDGLWVRLVDVVAALSARSYGSGEALVFDVIDSFCPWNQGRVTLEKGVARRSQDTPDIKCGVAALGSVYLGGFTFRELAEAGIVEELRSGAISRADALFQVGLRPWCPEIF